MRKLSFVLALLMCLTLFTGCSKEEQNNKGDFLNTATWNMSKEELKKLEEQAVENGDILQRRQTDEFADIFGHDVTLSYSFTEDKLTSITINIVPNQGESIAQARASTRAALDAAYGASAGDDHGARWETEHALIQMFVINADSDTFVLYYSPK